MNIDIITKINEVLLIVNIMIHLFVIKILFKYKYLCKFIHSHEIHLLVNFTRSLILTKCNACNLFNIAVTIINIMHNLGNVKVSDHWFDHFNGILMTVALLNYLFIYCPWHINIETFTSSHHGKTFEPNKV